MTTFDYIERGLIYDPTHLLGTGILAGRSPNKASAKHQLLTLHIHAWYNGLTAVADHACPFGGERADLTRGGSFR